MDGVSLAFAAHRDAADGVWFGAAAEQLQAEGLPALEREGLEERVVVLAGRAQLKRLWLDRLCPLAFAVRHRQQTLLRRVGRELPAIYDYPPTSELLGDDRRCPAPDKRIQNEVSGLGRRLDDALQKLDRLLRRVAGPLDAAGVATEHGDVRPDVLQRDARTLVEVALAIRDRAGVVLADDAFGDELLHALLAVAPVARDPKDFVARIALGRPSWPRDVRLVVAASGAFLDVPVPLSPGSPPAAAGTAAGRRWPSPWCSAG